MNRKKGNIFRKAVFIALICIPILSLTLLERDSGVSAKTQDTYKHLEIFSNVLSLVKKNYVEEIDTKEIIEGAIKGLLTTLDPHSSFMKADDFKELQVETKGCFSGIGIEIAIRDGILTVVSPIEGTPAFKKGLKAGDKIVKIEDEPTKDFTLMEAVKRLRGTKGTKVTISIHRKGWRELKEVTIVRDVIPLHSVKSRWQEPGYPYVRITNFQSKTTKDLQKVMKEFSDKEEIKGLLFDLRSNPGGLLDQAVKVSDLFLRKGLIVSTKGRIKEQNMTYKAHSGGTYYDFPIVVLVNEGSASASEIVAGALQDHKRALILGAQTFGKGSVQTIIPMNNGAGIRLTTARYYTPNGTSIQAKGIAPDIIVPTPVFTREEIEEKKIRKHKFLREKDLINHMENGDDPEEDAEEKIMEQEEMDDEETSVDDSDDVKEEVGDEDEESRKKEELENDPQLKTALMLLKGLNVFQDMKK
ncbi:MAG: S41 family peptidase [Thermodesulfobacteriota bacterium]|nr:S41 family peptidase [Thermodesulfobacteriota bacterium]